MLGAAAIIMNTGQRQHSHFLLTYIWGQDTPKINKNIFHPPWSCVEGEIGSNNAIKLMYNVLDLHSCTLGTGQVYSSSFDSEFFYHLLKLINTLLFVHLTVHLNYCTHVTFLVHVRIHTVRIYTSLVLGGSMYCNAMNSNGTIFLHL